MRLYEKWLKALQEEIREAITEAEEAGWHHLPEDGAEARRGCYTRLLTWEAEVDERVRWLDHGRSARN